MELANPAALIAFTAVLPVILLYFLKPKPKEIEIPSLMFFLEAKREERLKSFLQRFIRDPLLLLQLAIISLFALSMAAPFYMTQEQVREENVVMIMDASASMQSSDVAPSRFERARELALSALSKNSKYSVILAENVPALVLRDGSEAEAKAVLSQLKAKATPTNLADALLLARELLRGRENKRVLVFSDFAASSGDTAAAAKLVEASGAELELVQVRGEGRNTAIVELQKRKGEYVLGIKNYAGVVTEVSIRVSSSAATATYTKTLQPSAKNFLALRNVSGEVVITLENSDALALDNEAFIYVPPPRAQKILLISDNASSYLRYVFSSMENLEIREVSPPVLPAFAGYDLIIIDDIKNGSLLPGTVRDLESYVRNGGGLIVIASQSLAAAEELAPLLPVKLSSGTGKGSVAVAVINEVTKDVDFAGVTTRYLLAQDNNASAVLARTSDGSPVLAYRELGKGKAAYLGIAPRQEWSDFVLRPSFPILWVQLIEFTKKKEAERNFRTGEFLDFESETSVNTPSTRLVAQKLLLDEVGFYEARGETFAVSLLDEQESNLSTAIEIQAAKGEDYKFKPALKDVKRELDYALLPALLLLLLLEILYLNYRGEL